MDNDLLLDAIVWAALGVALACIVARLAFPHRPGTEASPKEVPVNASRAVPGNAPGAGD